MRENLAKEKEKLFNSMIFRLLVVGIAAISVDVYLKTINSRHKEFVATQRELVEAADKPIQKTKEGKSHWDDYIDKRQAVLKKEQDEYHHTY